jgi:hypothetical protein
MAELMLRDGLYYFGKYLLTFQIVQWLIPFFQRWSLLLMLQQ